MSKRRRQFATASILLPALIVCMTEAQAGPDVIVTWNQVAQSMIGGPPFSQTRQYAMVHVAMADAVVAIQGHYAPFHANTWAPSGASPEAAAAQAAHDVLIALIPGQAAALDAALDASLAPIPPGLRATGVAVGRTAAAAILDWRKGDGFAAANPQPPPFLASSLPGIWQQTASGPAQYAGLGDVEPFGVLSATQFLPRPQPQLESSDYAEDYIEVLEKGPAVGSTRLPEETRSAQLWAGAGPWANVTNAFRLWHNVARDVASAKHLSLVDTARLFALLTTSIHDSVQTSHTSKFVYRLWRPETAIALAGIDNNASTVPQPGWVPLLTTPPYPSHASNMACIGAGAARTLANVFGTDAVAFTATWYSAAGAVVHAMNMNSFWALAVDEGNSRVWGGIHFRFELEESQSSCSAVADYIYANRMQPL